MVADAASRNSFRFWWPNAVAGLLLPFSTIQLRRWLPLWGAFFVAFILLFSAAGVVVVHRLSPTERSYVRILSGAFLGASVGAAFSYFFPWA